MAENLEKRQRTRKKLADALAELREEKSYYAVTFWDICSKAQMYRSTSYRYYETKNELLREIEHEYVEETRNLTKIIPVYRTGNATQRADRQSDGPPAVLPMDEGVKRFMLCRQFPARC